jgi:hypothetical protein
MAIEKTRTFVEEFIEEQRLQVFLLLECGSNVFQKDTLTNNKKGEEDPSMQSLTLMMHPPRHMRAIPA